MTHLFPTTTVAVYRDTDADDTDRYGDETETGAAGGPLHAAVPVAVVEDGQLRFAPADLRRTLVEQFTLRVTARWQIREGDRLVDRRTGDTYQVQGVSTPQGLIGVASSRLTCKRVATGE